MIGALCRIKGERTPSFFVRTYHRQRDCIHGIILSDSSIFREKEDKGNADKKPASGVAADTAEVFG